jgi:2-haloacid dehalogenase
MLASHQIGHVKPEQAYFQTALTRIGRQPQECLFIDDKDDNIVAGRAAGIPSIHFRGNAELRSDLAEHGLL